MRDSVARKIAELQYGVSEVTNIPVLNVECPPLVSEDDVINILYQPDENGHRDSDVARFLSPECPLELKNEFSKLFDKWSLKQGTPIPNGDDELGFESIMRGDESVETYTSRMETLVDDIRIIDESNKTPSANE